MRVAFFADRRDTTPRHEEFDTLRDLARRYAEHERRTAKDGALWSPAEYRAGASRGLRGVLAVHAAVLDLDGLTESEADAVLDRLAGIGLAAWVYSTWSHGSAWSLRIAMPLTRPATAEEWPKAWRALHALVPESDVGCKDASRIYYLPSYDGRVTPINTWLEGRALDVDVLLAEPDDIADAIDVSAGEAPEPGAITPEVRLWCQRQLDRACARVRACAFPGPVYPVLNGESYRIGRYVPHVFEVEHVETAIMRAVDERDKMGVYREKNRAIVKRSIEDGARTPWRPAPWLPITEMDMGSRLVRDHGAHMRYVVEWQRWIEYIGHRWTLHGADACTFGAIREMARALREEAEYVPDMRARALREAARSLGSVSRATNVLRAARTVADAHIRIEAMDQNAHALVCANGSIDLRSGVLMEHRADDYATSASPVAYDPEATAPTWERFVLEVSSGDQELAHYLQIAIGYSLHGVIDEHALFFLYGDGANGKSTFLDTLRAVLGDYATVIPSDALLAKRFESHPTTIASMYGKRLVVTNEIDEGRAWDEALVKSLTGGDEIVARRMREDPWTWAPTHTLWVAGNYRPVVRGNDSGIWRRLRLVPFTASFLGREDRGLGRKLRAEGPGILAWAVRGAVAWWRARRLPDAAAVAVATEAYRTEHTPIEDFVAATLTVVADKGIRMSRAQVYQLYSNWCEREGQSVLSARSFTERMRRIPGVNEVRIQGAWHWTNLQKRTTNLHQA